MQSRLTGLRTTTPVAGREPKSTTGVPLKPEPVMVTVVPPAAGPIPGLTPMTIGPCS